ncbi:hypothetical protein EPN95_04720 [Patescibacteria group bacterium]|nr:MAG: hypothetical protein EPN95_04720 [Patescibacteria group bacterium]
MLKDILDKRPETESSATLPVKGYTEDRANMDDVAELIDLKSPGASVRVSMRVLKQIIIAVRKDPILREFFFRVTVNSVIPDRILVSPEGKKEKLA